MSKYTEFLAQKAVVWNGQGLDVKYNPHPVLFPFQAKIAEIALSKGRYAIFADIGGELKPSYFGFAVRNLEILKIKEGQLNIFNEVDFGN